MHFVSTELQKLLGWSESNKVENLGPYFITTFNLPNRLFVISL